MKTKELDTKTYNDLLQQAMQYIRHILSNIMEGETNASVK